MLIGLHLYLFGDRVSDSSLLWMLGKQLARFWDSSVPVSSVNRGLELEMPTTASNYLLVLGVNLGPSPPSASLSIQPHLALPPDRFMITVNLKMQRPRSNRNGLMTEKAVSLEIETNLTTWVNHRGWDGGNEESPHSKQSVSGASVQGSLIAKQSESNV